MLSLEIIGLQFVTTYKNLSPLRADSVKQDSANPTRVRVFGDHRLSGFFLNKPYSKKIIGFINTKPARH